MLEQYFLSDSIFGWIGLLVIALLLLITVKIRKEFIALALPVAAIIALLYLDAGLGFHFIIMCFYGCFLMAITLYQKG